MSRANIHRIHACAHNRHTPQIGLVYMGFIGSFHIITKLHVDPIKLVLNVLCHSYCIVYNAKFNIYFLMKINSTPIALRL